MSQQTPIPILIKVKCDYCHNQFKLPISVYDGRIKKGRSVLFCSPKCSQMSQRVRIDVECKTCGKQFERRPCFMKKYNFCSAACGRKWQQLNLSKSRYRICIACGAWIVVTNRRVSNGKYYRCRKCKELYAIEKILMSDSKKLDPRSYSKRFLKRIENCTGCGIKLTRAVRTHKHHSHSRCDICEYMARKKYKLKFDPKKFDAQLIEKMLITLALAWLGIDTITKKGELKEWQKTVIQKRMAMAINLH